MFFTWDHLLNQTKKPLNMRILYLFACFLLCCWRFSPSSFVHFPAELSQKNDDRFEGLDKKETFRDSQGAPYSTPVDNRVQPAKCLADLKKRSRLLSTSNMKNLRESWSFTIILIKNNSQNNKHLLSIWFFLGYGIFLSFFWTPKRKQQQVTLLPMNDAKAILPFCVLGLEACRSSAVESSRWKAAVSDSLFATGDLFNGENVVSCFRHW